MKHFLFLTCCIACGCLHAQTRTESIFFDHNQAVIRASDEIILLDIIETLNEYESYTIRLFGNTDAIGSNAYNQKLSQRRVEVVQRYLLQHGVNQSVMQLAAQGESNPAAENVTEIGKQRNRRTDIVVQYKLKTAPLTNVEVAPKVDVSVSETKKNMPSAVLETEKNTSFTVSETEKDALSALLPSPWDSTIASLSPADKIVFERNLLATNELYAKIANEPTVQIVKSSVKKSVVVTGKQGTRLILPPNVFNLPEGTPVTFTLREAYKMGDMLLENLTTQSGNQMLSSGGMVKITATVEGKSIQPNQPFTLLMPKDPNNPNPMANSMQLFTGVQTPNRPMNWQLNVDSGKQLMSRFDFEIWSEKWQKIKADKEIKRLLNDTCGCSKMFVWKMPYSIWKEYKKGFKKGEISQLPERYLFSDVKPKSKEYDFYKINHSKYTQYAKDSLSYFCHLIARDKTLPKNWTWERRIKYFPASIGVRQDSIRGVRRWTYPQYFRVHQLYFKGNKFATMLRNLDQDIKKMSDKFTLETQESDLDKAILRAEAIADSIRRRRLEIAQQVLDAKPMSNPDLVVAANYYIFQSTAFGWANCDYFTYSSPELLVRVKTKTLFKDAPNAKLIFKKQNIIFPPRATSTELTFYNVKKEEDALIVALKIENNQPFLAMQPFKTGAITLDLKYEPMTVEALKEKLKLLN